MREQDLISRKIIQLLLIQICDERVSLLPVLRLLEF